MVTLFLQDSLCRELERITEDMVFREPTGNRTQLKIYSQCLPILDGSEEPFPYCIVRIDSGSIPDAMTEQTVKTIIVIGLFDDAKEAQGHSRILTVMQRIQKRFMKDPILADYFRLQDGIEWTLQEEDTYPYYFGGMELSWQTASYRREDALA